MSLIGRKLRSIEIRAPLGEGGMSEVYIGFDHKLRRQVAVKALRHERRLEPSAKMRFLREARILSQLNHPKICQIHDFIQERDGDFLILELISGMDLKQAIGQGLDRREKMEIACQIADVLVAAHAMSVVHRDLKPENVMLRPDGSIVVLDFGLARSMEDSAEHKIADTQLFVSPETPQEGRSYSVTELGDILGTPKYMSPEQARGETVTAAGDIYSFGLLLQELFTGTPPYPPNLERLALMFKAMSGQTLPVEGVDAPLRNLIEQAKAPAPVDRPTAEEIAQRLNWIRDAPKRRAKRFAALSFIGVLIIATLLSGLGFLRARSAEQTALEEREKTQAVNDFLEDMLAAADPKKMGRDVKVTDVLDHAADLATEDFASRPRIHAEILGTLGRTYRAIGSYDQAHKQLQQAFEICQSEYGTEHVETLTIANDLAAALYFQGKYKEAQTMFQKAFDIAQKVHGPDAKETLNLQGNLATLLQLSGDYEAALTLLKDNLDRSQRVLGPEDPDTLSRMHNLARFYYRTGHLDEAAARYQEVLELKRRVLGETHPDTMNTFENLAVVTSKMGQFENAKKMFEEILEFKKRILGPEHPDTLGAQNNIAIVLEEQGHFAQAEALHRKTLEAKIRVLGEEHASTLNTMDNLGKVLARQDKFEDAEPVFRNCLELARKSLGEEHRDTLNSLSNLAMTLQLKGEFGEAERLQRRALEGHLKVLGETHPATLGCMTGLASTLCDLSRWDEGIALHRKALEAKEKVLGLDHPATAQSMYLLGKALAETGHPAEAEALLKQALEVRTKLLGSDHPDTQATRRELDRITPSSGQD